MKRLLQLGFFLGFAGTIAAAYFAPWFEYTRYRSAAQVVANGGRIEQFMVRLPADRIDSGTQNAASTPDGTPTQISHFKLRDADGNVIGVAARHEVDVAGGNETAWLLTIPSRGTMVLASAAPRSTSISEVLADRGLVPGRSLERELSVDFGGPSRSVATTGEFSGIDFELVETWVVSGLDEDGVVRGTLRLNTVGRQSI